MYTKIQICKNNNSFKFTLHRLKNLQVDHFQEDIVQVYHGLQALPNEVANDCSIKFFKSKT